MAELSAAQKEINRKRAEAGLPPRFPEPTSNTSLFGDLLNRDKGVTSPTTDNSDTDRNGVPDMVQRPTEFPNNLTPKSPILTGELPKYSFDMGGSFGGALNLASPKTEAAPKTEAPQTFAPAMKPNVDLGGRIGMSLTGSQSTSSLRQPARSLETQSGAMRREARRLRREGYFGEAGQMAAAAAMQRLNEPNIVTEAQRGRMKAQSKQAETAGQEAAAAQREYVQFMRDALKKKRDELKS